MKTYQIQATLAMRGNEEREVGLIITADNDARINSTSASFMVSHFYPNWSIQHISVEVIDS